MVVPPDFIENAQNETGKSTVLPTTVDQSMLPHHPHPSPRPSGPPLLTLWGLGPELKRPNHPPTHPSFPLPENALAKHLAVWTFQHHQAPMVDACCSIPQQPDIFPLHFANVAVLRLLYHFLMGSWYSSS